MLEAASSKSSRGSRATHSTQRTTASSASVGSATATTSVLNAALDLNSNIASNRGSTAGFGSNSGVVLGQNNARSSSLQERNNVFSRNRNSRTNPSTSHSSQQQQENDYSATSPQPAHQHQEQGEEEQPTISDLIREQRQLEADAKSENMQV